MPESTLLTHFFIVPIGYTLSGYIAVVKSAFSANAFSKPNGRYPKNGLQAKKHTIIQENTSVTKYSSGRPIARHQIDIRHGCIDLINITWAVSLSPGTVQKCHENPIVFDFANALLSIILTVIAKLVF